MKLLNKMLKPIKSLFRRFGLFDQAPARNVVDVSKSWGRFLMIAFIVFILGGLFHIVLYQNLSNNEVDGENGANRTSLQEAALKKTVETYREKERALEALILRGAQSVTP